MGGGITVPMVEGASQHQTAANEKSKFDQDSTGRGCIGSVAFAAQENTGCVQGYTLGVVDPEKLKRLCQRMMALRHELSTLLK